MRIVIFLMFVLLCGNAAHATEVQTDDMEFTGHPIEGPACRTAVGIEHLVSRTNEKENILYRILRTNRHYKDKGLCLYVRETVTTILKSGTIERGSLPRWFIYAVIIHGDPVMWFVASDVPLDPSPTKPE